MKINTLILLTISCQALSSNQEGTGTNPAHNAAPQHHILCTAPTAALMLQNQANEYTSNAEASARCVDVLQQEGTQGQVIRSN